MMAGPRLWLKGKRKAIKMIKRRHPFCLKSNIFFALIMPIVLMSTLLCPFKDLIVNLCMLPAKLKLIYCYSSSSISFHTKFLVQHWVFGEGWICTHTHTHTPEMEEKINRRTNKKREKIPSHKKKKKRCHELICPLISVFF